MSETRLTVAAGVAVVAGTVTLAPVFQNGSYFWSCTGAVLAVSLAGYGARRLALPRPLVLLATLAGLVSYLTVMYARDEALLWVIPDASTVTALRDLYDTGMVDIGRFAAPVRPYEGIVAITAAGVGAIAVMVDLIAVTLRHAAIAGLPLLALYSVPAAVVPDGVGWFPFVLGAAGYLGLLLADGRERVLRWGRPLGRSTSDRHPSRAFLGEVQTSGLSRVGRRVGAVALGVSVVVPALLPNLDQGVFGPGGPGFGDGNGSRTVNVVNPIVDLRRDLARPVNRTVIRYDTDDPAPGYLRMATLDSFTGDSWVPAKLEATSEQDVGQGIPEPADLADIVKRTRRTSTFAIGDLRDPRLPLPYPAVEVSADGEWRYDEATRNVFSFRNDTRGLRYEVESLDIAPSASTLRASPAGGSGAATTGYTQLPDDLPGLVRRLASQVTGNVVTNYDKALAIQQWLREFTYSLEARPGNGGSALVDFLTDRSGYCEQFAATMALMARAEGIPARVNVGFTQGRRLADGTWQVTLHDTHAWPELYFPGVGWVPFEPTPRGDGSTPAPTYADADDVQDPNGSGASPGGPGSASGSGDPRSANEQRTREELELARRRLDGQLGSRGTGGAGADEESGGLPVLPLTLAGLVLVSAITPATARVVLRRRRASGLVASEDGVQVAWSEVEDTAWDHGLPRRPQETPQAFAERLVSEAQLSSGPAAAVRRLARSCARARFAPTLGAVGDVRADVGQVRGGLAESSSASTRWRARLMPASTRAMATWVSERIADALDWLDESGTRLRAAFTRAAGRRGSAG
ncbi:MAG: transglutaminase TgpA family protein [Actinomycetes bacterium]